MQIFYTQSQDEAAAAQWGGKIPYDFSIALIEQNGF